MLELLIDRIQTHTHSSNIKHHNKMHTYIYKSRHWVPSVLGPRELSAFLSHIIIKYFFLSSTHAAAGTDLCRILLDWFVNIHSNWGTYVCIYILGWFIYSTSFKKLMFDFKWNTARALRKQGTLFLLPSLGHWSQWVTAVSGCKWKSLMPTFRCGLIGRNMYI